MIKTHNNESFRLLDSKNGTREGMFTCDDGEKVDERETGRSQVDKVSEVKFRRYRVSCKEASEQGRGAGTQSQSQDKSR